MKILVAIIRSFLLLIIVGAGLFFWISSMVSAQDSMEFHERAMAFHERAMLRSSDARAEYDRATERYIRAAMLHEERCR